MWWDIRLQKARQSETKRHATCRLHTTIYNARIKSIRNAFSHFNIHGSPFSSLLPYPIALLRLIHNPTALKFSLEKSVVFFVHNRDTGAGTNSHQTPPLPAC